MSVDDIVHTIQQPVPATLSLTYPLPPPSLRQVLSVMRVSARPTIASFRQIISRRFASTEAQNPQVKAAVESATKAYDNALGSAKRVAGPIGERVGSMMGGECARSIGRKEHRSVAASRSRLSEPHIPYNPLITYHLLLCSTSAGYKDPIVYNFKVLASLARQVYIAEKMAPPTNLSAYVNSYANIWSNAVSPNFWKGLAQNGQWAKVGVVVSAGVLRL